jgi:UDP-N-acetylglucosamine transferase subunit ALG13
MIFVTVGTNEAPFDRLLAALGEIDTTETIVVQHGSSTVRPNRTTCLDFLPYDDLIDYVRKARVVVTHAGVGSVLMSAANGIRPIVVPRRRHYNEAVDDHQLPFARRLHTAGVVTLVEDPSDLPAALALAEGAQREPLPAVGCLVEDLRAYLALALHANGKSRAGYSR